MTTLANQNIVSVEEPKPTLVNSAAGSGDNSGLLTRGGINPSAAAMLILYQVMALYAEITGINAEEQKTQITATQQQAKAEGDAIKQAGHDLGMAMIIGASTALVMSGAAAVAGAMQTKAMKNNNKDTVKAEEELTSIKKIHAVEPDPAAVSGVDDSRVGLRKTQLRNGQYKSNCDDATTEQAVTEMSAEPDFPAFKDRMSTREESLERRRNTNALNNDMHRQKLSMLSQVGNSAGQTTNNVAQAIGNMNKANEDANAALNRSSAQMSQQSGSAQQEAARRAGEAQNGVVNILSAIRQASSNV